MSNLDLNRLKETCMLLEMDDFGERTSNIHLYVKNHRSETGGMKRKLHHNLQGPVVLDHAQKFSAIK